MASDIYHYWGGDIAVAADGDFSIADATTTGQQRVLRRLLTNPGEYLWHPDYGAGVRKLLGGPLDLARVRGAIRSQILLEAAVAKSPEPVITVQEIVGGVSVFIQYQDAATSEPSVLSLDVTV
jgi:phage baseplate assembly protein W